MYCSNCGNKLNEGDLFCANCGEKTTQQTSALEIFHSIRNHVQSNRELLDSGELKESTEAFDAEKVAHRAIAKAAREQLRKGWGEKFVNKADDIDDKGDVLKILQEEVEAQRISDDEIQEIFNSEDFINFISVEDIVLIVREDLEKWGNSSILKQNRKFQDRAKKTGTDFVGRHQELIMVKQLLGDEITNSEKQIAINKDVEERDQILQQIQDLEIYVNSDLFVAHEATHVSSVSKSIQKIIDAGFDNCVLQNDRELDQRCFKLLSEIEALMKDKYLSALAKGKITPEQMKQWEKLPELVSIKGFFKWMDLGEPPLTKGGDVQQAWVILATLRQPNKQIGIHSASNYLSQLIGSMPLNGVNKVVARYRTVRDNLVHNNKLTDEEGRTIDMLIEDGLMQNKKIHEQYPDRP